MRENCPLVVLSRCLYSIGERRETGVARQGQQGNSKSHGQHKSTGYDDSSKERVQQKYECGVQRRPGYQGVILSTSVRLRAQQAYSVSWPAILQVPFRQSCHETREVRRSGSKHGMIPWFVYGKGSMEWNV